MAENEIKEFAERVEEAPGHRLEIGQWYWTKDGDGEEHFACIVHVGSNYVQLETPRGDRLSWHNFRIHFNEFRDKCTRIENPQKIIADNSERVRGELGGKLREVQQLTHELGLQHVGALPEPSVEGTLLPVHSRGQAINSYKGALIAAKDKQLPALFEEIKDLNAELTFWLSAESVPMKAMAKKMEGAIDVVEDRIFHVELYAGLIENVKHVREGQLAGAGDKLHIMQRRCYMDEECLIDYQHGGMDFSKIGEFDAWLSKEHNMKRILPFPKCMVSFRVRRGKKFRRAISPTIRISLEEDDEATFLYMRNGDNLYRLNTKIDFGDKLFPDSSEFHPGEKIWAEMFAESPNKIIPDRLYQARLKEHREQERLCEEWEKRNPDTHWIHNPHRHIDYNINRYEPCDPSSVYFDDIRQKIADEAKQYNRIALIVQGLFDRSEILHPHPPVRMWDENSFQSYIKLIYDAEMVLTDGDPEDFNLYRMELNESITEGTVTVGQQLFWGKKEAAKENKRQESDWRIQNPTEYDVYEPYGDPGPGLLAKVVRYQPKAKRCIFKWTRERRSFNYSIYRSRGSRIPCTLTVPSGELLNVDAYKPGDYHKFFDDPRTRRNYLQWAPMLLAAEDYHAGKLAVGNGEEMIGKSNV